MPDSLIEELPKIVAQGKKEAQKILDGLSARNRITDSFKYQLIFLSIK